MYIIPANLELIYISLTSLTFQGGIYTLPSHLSGAARDLIPRMLVVDPMKRITIREIREHDWFKIHLPRYLTVSPPDSAQQVKKVQFTHWCPDMDSAAMSYCLCFFWWQLC